MCAPPVGSIVKERCGWQEWKAHARASGFAARATGPSARAHEHARAAFTRVHVHAHIGGCGPTRVYMHARRTHGCDVHLYTYIHTQTHTYTCTCAKHTCKRPSSANSSADFFGPSRSLRSQNPALALSHAALSRSARVRTRVYQAFLCEVIFFLMI